MTGYLVAAITALLAIGGAWWTVHATQQERDALRSTLVTERAAWSAASQASAERQREIEALRTKARDHEIETVRADAARDAGRVAALSDVAAKLRVHVTRIATASCQASADPAAATGSAAASGPGMVLSDLYRGVDDEAIQLAGALDRSRRAGLACERTYETLRANQ